jgi:galactitol-specific phosphotransferase system IIC component
MLFSDFLQIIAVLIEVVITVIAVLLATRRQKPYGWGIAVTFGLFVIFDIIRIFALPVPEAAQALSLLVACGSMLYAIWLMYKEH